jgi:hypothetical protein
MARSSKLNTQLRTSIRHLHGSAKSTRIILEPVIAEGQDPAAAILNPNGRYQFVGGNAGSENAFFKTDKNNFAPNVSFAYTPGFNNFLFGENKTVIRGGYRISYINDEFVASALNAGTGNAGLSTTQSALNPAGTSTALNARIGNLPTITTPVFDPDRTFAENNTGAFSFFGTVYAIDPEIQTPMVQEYSLGLQRELGFDTAFEVRYVGTRSKNLLRAIDLNQINIRTNGFLADFNRARSNFLLTGNAACTTAGCQPLTVFPNLGSGGLLTNATIQANLVNGTPADLAFTYITNGLAGTVPFLANPNTGVADLLGNFGRFNYNSLQVEVRRRFAQGFQLQANYTFSKNLTNSQGAQTNGTGDTQTVSTRC